jgi:hypothetical protein
MTNNFAFCIRVNRRGCFILMAWATTADVYVCACVCIPLVPNCFRWRMPPPPRLWSRMGTHTHRRKRENLEWKMENGKWKMDHAKPSRHGRHLSSRHLPQLSNRMVPDGEGKGAVQCLPICQLKGGYPGHPSGDHTRVPITLTRSHVAGGDRCDRIANRGGECAYHQSCQDRFTGPSGAGDERTLVQK